MAEKNHGLQDLEPLQVPMSGRVDSQLRRPIQLLGFFTWPASDRSSGRPGAFSLRSSLCSFRYVTWRCSGRGRYPPFHALPAVRVAGGGSLGLALFLGFVMRGLGCQTGELQWSKTFASAGARPVFAVKGSGEPRKGSPDEVIFLTSGPAGRWKHKEEESGSSSCSSWVTHV